MSTQGYRGSCHCGAVTYSAAIDLAAGTFRCNCSICTKSRAWIAAIPTTAFTLETGADRLSRYSFGAGSIVRFFCRNCGTKTHATGAAPELGGAFVGVVVATLDLEPCAFERIPIAYLDGRTDRFDRTPEHTGYL